MKEGKYTEGEHDWEGDGGPQSMARSLFDRTKVHAMFCPKACSILGPVLKFDIYFVPHF